ncbi:hypothetical protein AB0B45_50910 [Nonomuraea sp. NPDC049152]|uniref:hypothetical protein n=1 Tax=Nonomuraea sp. NPDC049152 TaxID=3154350 RepID=UPI0033E3092C
MTPFPVENQQQLLVAHGLDRWFGAQWVSIEDRHEVARRLNFPAETIETCDFQTALRSYDPVSPAQRVWITSHAPGWSHVLLLSGGQASSAEALSRHGRRVFEISYIGGIEEIEELTYVHDGEYRSVFDEEEYRVHWADLPNDNMMSETETLDQYLIIIGRITGRFLGHDWVSSQGLLCVMP